MILVPVFAPQTSLAMLRFSSFLFFLWIGISLSKAQGLNQDLGLPLWQGSSLWVEDAASVARRLKIPGGSNEQTGHFKKNFEADTKIFGVRAYTIEIYSEKSKVGRVNIGLINRADLFNEVMQEAKASGKSLSEAQAFVELEKRMLRDAPTDFATLTANIARRLGRPNIKDEPQEKIWDWSGHLLAAERTPTAITLKISSPEKARLADVTDPARAAMNAAAKSRDSVKRRPNGDVVISGIPPISQGPRGFCVPASWEKLIRFNGLDLDVYQLADRGGTDVQGTMLAPFAAKMATLLEPKGFLVQFPAKGPPTMDVLRNHIDAGRPVLWGMDSRQFPAWVARSVKRTTRLPTAPPATPPPDPAPHALLIIGYNAGFQEVALSDSTELGARFPEIWISMADVQASDMGQDLVVLTPKTTSTSGTSGNSSPTGHSTKRWY
ncbi:MAG: hypothetical protein OHK005_15400 [Candidatus Methylacidiphilales bacterium]